MKNKVIRPVVLILFFFGSLVTFSILTNKSNEDMTTNMAAATLPVLYFWDEEIELNELHGYVRPMTLAKMRDSITPVNSSRILTVGVNTYGTRVDKLSYEIRGLDGERLLANGEVRNFEKNGNLLKAEIQVQNLLEAEEEYNLVFTLQSGSDDIYYYTRLMQTTSSHVEECLDFAREFHEYTFKEKSKAAEFIPTYMDPATGDATTLDYVDLSCTLNQIVWADFPKEKLTDPQISVKEINSSYNVILFRYMVNCKNGNGESEYYNVEEYYRLRYTTDRMYVLNFERRMNQIFRGENSFITDGSRIQLGIRKPEVEYTANEAGNVVAFVQEGELWCFNITTNELSRVFGFRSAEGFDLRENWDRFEIKIEGIDEAGSVSFLVFGYMNRGEHEGEIGIGTYYYDGLAHTIEEQAFIPLDCSYEVVKAELGQMLYKNDKDKLYLMLNQEVYKIDLVTLEVTAILKDIRSHNCASSENGRYFAWVDSAVQDSSETICIMDLREETVQEIREEGCYLKPLGFIHQDFIYGIANREDVYVDAAGNTVFPMVKLKILDMAEKGYPVLKEYAPENECISGIAIRDYIIDVDLIIRKENQYVAAGNDTIMNREAGTKENVQLTSTATEVKETQRQLVLKKAPKTTEVKRVRPKSILLEEQRLVQIPESTKNCFYVYQKGNVLLATESISDAILRANSKMGIVVDSRQQYVWKRARKNHQASISNLRPSEGDLTAGSIAQCVSAMLAREGVGITVRELLESGQTPKAVLMSTLRDYEVLDLTGCTVDEILYYVSNGSPVFAMTGEEDAVLVVGYSTTKIFSYDPNVGQTISLNYDEANELFKNAGNIFFSYLKK